MPLIAAIGTAGLLASAAIYYSYTLRKRAEEHLENKRVQDRLDSIAVS